MAVFAPYLQKKFETEDPSASVLMECEDFHTFCGKKILRNDVFAKGVKLLVVSLQLGFRKFGCEKKIYKNYGCQKT